MKKEDLGGEKKVGEEEKRSEMCLYVMILEIYSFNLELNLQTIKYFCDKGTILMLFGIYLWA